MNLLQDIQRFNSSLNIPNVLWAFILDYIRVQDFVLTLLLFEMYAFCGDIIALFESDPYW
ncbi:hypothetical protein Csa_010521 [Cucumis sativus]|uniref:Uncharacterized protein n=1 Tax=Cucumis sativus TaxID=3659 RepID=A0A0A0LAJ7_CUCSA|nr:hypothetical protein Csa_010521 [Cucumis sativus]